MLRYFRNFEHPRIVIFLLQGFLLVGLGTLLRAAGRLFDPTLVPLGQTALLVGTLTVVLGAIAYAVSVADDLLKDRLT
jgi:uncharacterized membrane protein